MGKLKYIFTFFKSVFSYKLSERKFWKAWFKNDFSQLYYGLLYNWRVNNRSGCTMIPETGKGKYVSVYSKGEIIQIIDEENEFNEIRIIPVQCNHGVMVESWREGKLIWRRNLDIQQLNKDVIYSSNAEILIQHEKSKLRNEILPLIRKRK